VKPQPCCCGLYRRPAILDTCKSVTVVGTYHFVLFSVTSCFDASARGVCISSVPLLERTCRCICCSVTVPGAAAVLCWLERPVSCLQEAACHYCFCFGCLPCSDLTHLYSLHGFIHFCHSLLATTIAPACYCILLPEATWLRPGLYRACILPLPLYVSAWATTFWPLVGGPADVQPYLQ